MDPRSPGEKFTTIVVEARNLRFNDDEIGILVHPINFLKNLWKSRLLNDNLHIGQLSAFFGLWTRQNLKQLVKRQSLWGENLQSNCSQKELLGSNASDLGAWNTRKSAFVCAGQKESTKQVYLSDQGANNDDQKKRILVHPRKHVDFIMNLAAVEFVENLHPNQIITNQHVIVKYGHSSCHSDRNLIQNNLHAESHIHPTLSSITVSSPRTLFQGISTWINSSKCIRDFRQATMFRHVYVSACVWAYGSAHVLCVSKRTSARGVDHDAGDSHTPASARRHWRR